MTINEFNDFYRGELSEILKVIEEERKKLLSHISKRILIIIVAFLFTLMIEKLTQASGIIVILFIIGAVSFLYFSCSNRYRDYYKNYKTRIIGSIVKFLDGSLQYEPYHYIPEEIFIESNIFNTSIDRYSGSDYVYGKVGYTSIEFSQIHAEYKTETTHQDNDGHETTEEHWHTIFQGIFFVADFNKNFTTQVLLWPDESVKFLKSFKKKFAFLSGWKVIELEDPEFHRYFIAYGEDHIEARYILSTSLVRRIVEFKKKANRKIYISFVNSRLYVGIPCNTLFKPSIFCKAIDYEQMKEYFLYLNLVYGIVNDFNLNTRIWSKSPFETKPG